MSHRRTSSSNCHFDHGFVFFTDDVCWWSHWNRLVIFLLLQQKYVIQTSSYIVQQLLLFHSVCIQTKGIPSTHGQEMMWVRQCPFSKLLPRGNHFLFLSSHVDVVHMLTEITQLQRPNAVLDVRRLRGDKDQIVDVQWGGGIPRRCEGSVRGHWCCELAARFDWPSQQCTSEHRLQRGSRYCHAPGRREGSTLGSSNSLAARPSGSEVGPDRPRSRVKPTPPTCAPSNLRDESSETC